MKEVVFLATLFFHLLSTILCDPAGGQDHLKNPVFQ